ncbi:MAG: crosslink repair DNA glycosylase YcaQ family protein [Ilumatobacteraceae bacterium]
MADIHLSRQAARRIAIIAQRLDASLLVDGLVPLVEHLTALQLDPTAAIAPSVDLVAWSRLGSSYRPEQMRDGLETERTLFEYRGFIRPMSDLALYRPVMNRWPYEHPGWSQRVLQWMTANSNFQRYLLTELDRSGPLLSRELEDRCDEPWPSSGWTNNRNVTQMLEFLAAQGKVAIASRAGKQRLWDLAEQVYPANVPQMDAAQAEAERDSRRLWSLGIIRPAMAGAAGVSATVEGVAGEWRVHPDLIDAPFVGRTALISPFDRLVHDRVRMQELFEFEYKLEMFVPAAKRVWGYYALPVLHGDRLVARLDAKVDRKRKQLRVNALHPDPGLSRAATEAIDDEVDDLATWLHVTVDR